MGARGVGRAAVQSRKRDVNWSVACRVSWMSRAVKTLGFLPQFFFGSIDRYRVSKPKGAVRTCPTRARPQPHRNIHARTPLYRWYGELPSFQEFILELVCTNKFAKCRFILVGRKKVLSTLLSTGTNKFAKCRFIFRFAHDVDSPQRYIILSTMQYR